MMISPDFTTNGEFNSLRWHGINRRLSILQVRTEARAKYAQKGYKTLMAMLSPIGKYMYRIVYSLCTKVHRSLTLMTLLHSFFAVLVDGSVVAQKQNACVMQQKQNACVM